MPKSKLTTTSPKHPDPPKATEKNKSASGIRYSNKKLVSQKQMDDAVRSGMLCLETWEVARPISFSSKLQKAINLATLKHKDQKRKSDGLPYIVHPFSVMLILSQYTDNEDILVAALLHDVLEDTDYTAQELEQDFGPKVLKIVSEVTEPKKAADGSKLPWRTSKDAYFAGLEKASQEALMVAAADKIHNMNSIAKAYLEQGAPLWLKFSSPKDQQLWFYEQGFNIIQSKLNHPLVKDLKQVLQNLQLKAVIK